MGGIYLNDIREKDAIPSYSMVDREKQKAALDKALELAKNLEWVDDDAHAKEFEIADEKADRLRLDIFNGIFGRLPYVEVCTERFPDAAYTASEYLDDIYGVVWEGVLKHRPLKDFERALQTAFLEVSFRHRQPLRLSVVSKLLKLHLQLPASRRLIWLL